MKSVALLLAWGVFLSAPADTSVSALTPQELATAAAKCLGWSEQADALAVGWNVYQPKGGYTASPHERLAIVRVSPRGTCISAASHRAGDYRAIPANAVVGQAWDTILGPGFAKRRYVLIQTPDGVYVGASRVWSRDEVTASIGPGLSSYGGD